MEVTSEVLPDFEGDTISKPQLSQKHVISKIFLKLPNESNCVSLDDDGDYEMARNTSAAEGEEISICLEHRVSTVLSEVGLQVWRGALLLADFLLNNISTIKDKNVLELGAGVGLTSIVAGIFAKSVTCTDIDHGGILDLIRCNVKRNIPYLKAKVHVLPLNFLDAKWSDDVQKAIDEANVILAADVIYDNTVTDAFLRVVERIFREASDRKVLYLALEKRYVFTVADLDIVAPCYEHLLEGLWDSEVCSNLSLRQLDITFPQRVRYERVKELVLWQINN